MDSKERFTGQHYARMSRTSNCQSSRFLRRAFHKQQCTRWINVCTCACDIAPTLFDVSAATVLLTITFAVRVISLYIHTHHAVGLQILPFTLFSFTARCTADPNRLKTDSACSIDHIKNPPALLNTHKYLRTVEFAPSAICLLWHHVTELLWIAEMFCRDIQRGQYILFTI